MPANYFFDVLDLFYFDTIFKIAENTTTLNIEFQGIIFRLGVRVDRLKPIGCTVFIEVENHRFDNW